MCGFYTDTISWIVRDRVGLLLKSVCEVHTSISEFCVLLASERSERDTLSRSSMKNAIRIYIYIYIYYIDA